MKKIHGKAIALILSLAFVIGCLPAVSASAASYSDSGATIVDSGGTLIGMAGTTQNTILSVTMPSYIPFELSRNISMENKAVSPRIDITNNSEIPVEVYVSDVDCDFSQIPYCCLDTDPEWVSQSSYELAVGFQVQQTAPSTFRNAKWFHEGIQHMTLTTISAKDTQSMYVVAALGTQVPDGRSFTLIPTVVVSATN